MRPALLCALLGACRVWCRNSHFYWSILDLETPQFEHFFRNWHFSQSHWAYVFGLTQSGFGMWNIILKGSLSNVHILAQKFTFFSQKKTLGLRNLRFYKKKSAQSQWAFVLVCLYSRIFDMLVKDDYWSLLDVQMKYYHFFRLNTLLRG